MVEEAGGRFSDGFDDLILVGLLGPAGINTFSFVFLSDKNVSDQKHNGQIDPRYTR